MASQTLHCTTSLYSPYPDINNNFVLTSMNFEFCFHAERNFSLRTETLLLFCSIILHLQDKSLSHLKLTSLVKYYLQVWGMCCGCSRSGTNDRLLQEAPLSNPSAISSSPVQLQLLCAELIHSAPPLRHLQHSATLCRVFET